MEKEKNRSKRQPELPTGTPLNPEMMVGIGSQRFRYAEESIEEEQEDYLNGESDNNQT